MDTTDVATLDSNSISALLDALLYVYQPILLLVAVIGFILIFVGVIRLSRHVKGGQSSRHNSPMATIFYFISGSSLIAVTNMLQAISETVVSGSFNLNTLLKPEECKLVGSEVTVNNPVCYYTSQILPDDPLMQMQYLIFALLLVIGLISFCRGVFLLIHLGEGQGQHASSGVAIVHIVAGVVAVNAQGILKLLGMIV